MFSISCALWDVPGGTEEGPDFAKSQCMYITLIILKHQNRLAFPGIQLVLGLIRLLWIAYVNRASHVISSHKGGENDPNPILFESLGERTEARGHPGMTDMDGYGLLPFLFLLVPHKLPT